MNESVKTSPVVFSCDFIASGRLLEAVLGANFEQRSVEVLTTFRKKSENYFQFIQTRDVMMRFVDVVYFYLTFDCG